MDIQVPFCDEKSVQLVRGASFRNDFLQNPYFNALSFYWSKMILDRSNDFGRVPIVLGGSNSFWLGQNHFGQVQIIKISPEKYNMNKTKMIWTRPKQFELIFTTDN